MDPRQLTAQDLGGVVMVGRGGDKKEMQALS